MAIPLNRIGVIALRSTFRVRPRRAQNPQLYLRRNFRITPPFRDDSKPSDSTPNAPTQRVGETEEDTVTAASSRPVDEYGEHAEENEDGNHTAEEVLAPKPVNKLEAADQPFQPGADDISLRLTLEEKREMEELIANPPDGTRDMIEEIRREFNIALESVAKESELETEADLIRDSMIKENARNDLLSMGDEDGEPFEDESFEGDDITSLAHGELEQHREMREYARIAAWEMPRLAKLAKPFELPPASQPLRFRYTSYMGEQHPAENKVVLEFCTADLPLKPAERLKLIKLLGVRYDPQTDMAKMSCENFDSQAQNKRFLGDIVEKLVATARGKGQDEAAKDSFEDVSVDFRHVKWKQKPQFPEDWKMTPERQKLLREQRAAIASMEQGRIDEGTVVDGARVVAESLKVPLHARFLSNSKSRMATQGTQQRRPEMRIR